VSVKLIGGKVGAELRAEMFAPGGSKKIRHIRTFARGVVTQSSQKYVQRSTGKSMRGRKGATVVIFHCHLLQTQVDGQSVAPKVSAGVIRCPAAGGGVYVLL
jgi:hypothetical protein